MTRIKNKLVESYSESNRIIFFMSKLVLVVPVVCLCVKYLVFLIWIVVHSYSSQTLSHRLRPLQVVYQILWKRLNRKLDNSSIKVG